MALFNLSPVHNVRCIIIYFEIFRIHLMLRQVLHLYRAESAKACMKGYFRKFHTHYFQPFYQLTAEVHTSGWSRNSTFILCVNCLVTFFIFSFRFAFDVFG